MALTKEDLQAIADLLQPIQAIQEDIQELKQRTTAIEVAVQKLDQRTTELNQRTTEIESTVQELKRRTTNIELTLENETNRNIRIIAEGHRDLSRKLDDALKVESEKELLLIRVNILEGELRKVKERLAQIA